MRKLGLLLLLVAVMFVYSNAASAAGIQKGASEFTASGSIDRVTTTSEWSYGRYSGSSKESSNGATVNLGYSYFLTDQISAGANLMVNGTKTKEDYGTTTTTTKDVTTGIDLNAKYHFIFSKSQTVVPYLGLQGGWIEMTTKSTDGSASASAPSYGGMGGVKFFITENVSFNTELNYRKYNVTYDFGPLIEAKSNINDLKLLFGLSYYFGK